MIISTDDGGWVSVSEWGGLNEVRIRFSVMDDGRLEPTQVYVVSEAKITGDALRSLPLGHLEAWANGGGREVILRSLERAPRVDKATDRWRGVVDGSERMVVTIDPESLKWLQPRALRVKVPSGSKKPDSFYEEIAGLYTMLADRGSRRPAQAIADANEGLEITTVHRWIKEARRRGLLGSGRRGKTG